MPARIPFITGAVPENGTIIGRIPITELSSTQPMYDTEPIPADYALLNCAQVVLTPHVADQNPEGMEILNCGAIDNVIAFLQGKPQNRVV